MPEMPILTAFARSPDRGRGLARDLRVRWALGELGQPYDVRLVEFSELKAPAHRVLHPFGQIPTYEDGDVVLFESGAIVLHLAERHAGLLPRDPAARARATSWLFAALSTVEPPLVDREVVLREEQDRPWFEERLPLVEARALRPLDDLARRLGEADWLEGEFTVGDLMMIAVLFRARVTGILDRYPNLSSYVARGESRPAFRSAFEAQRALFEAAQRTAG